MADHSMYLERLTPDNCAMVLIDHQTGTMLGVQDFRLDSFRRNVLTIAGAAKLHSLPTVLTGSYVEGPNGPIMDELVKMFPDAPIIHRPGQISAWDDPNFVSAVEKLGKKKLIMAGVTIDVCLMFPVQQAIAAGYEVYAVYDASGCWDQLSELTSILRLVQMGAVVLNSLAVVADLQGDWRKPTAPGTLDLFKECNPFYDFLGSNQAANKRSA